MYGVDTDCDHDSSIPGLYSSIMLSYIVSSLSRPKKQVRVQVRSNNYNNIGFDDSNSIHIIPYCIYGVDTDQENGYVIKCEVPVLVQVLDCGMMRLGYISSVVLDTRSGTSTFLDRWLH